MKKARGEGLKKLGEKVKKARGESLKKLGEKVEASWKMEKKAGSWKRK